MKPSRVKIEWYEFGIKILILRLREGKVEGCVRVIAFGVQRLMRSSANANGNRLCAENYGHCALYLPKTPPWTGAKHILNQMRWP